jgi:glycogen(starch) synthase
MTGGVSPAKVDALMRRCLFFVLPSRRENLPLAVLEAMRAGKAVLASAAGGVGELVRNGIDGLTAEPGDVAGLARGIESLASRPALRRRLGRAARVRSLRFTWARAAADYARLYARATADRRSSAGIRSKK